MENTTRDAAGIKETATIIGCSVPTIYREIADGNIRAKKLRGRTIITKEERERYLRDLPDFAGAA